MNREIKIAELEHRLTHIDEKLKVLEESDIRPLEKYCKYIKVLKLKKKIKEELECTLVKGLLDLC